MPDTQLLNPPVVNESKSQIPLKQPPRKKASGKLKWWMAASVVVVLAIATWMYFRGSEQPVYVTATLDRGLIQATVTATGNTNAVTTVQVGSQVSGNIIALYADFNTKVKKGQLVARIDPAPFQAKVDQAKATLASAKAAVVTARATVTKANADIANAEANVANQQANVVRAQSAATNAKQINERQIQLAKAGIIDQQDAETAQSTYDQAVASVKSADAAVVAAKATVASAQAEKEVAEAQLEAAEAQVMQSTAVLQAAQLDLDHTRILAPVDGTVVSRNMDVGQTVAASFQAPTIFLIAQDLKKMQVDTNVDESDVGPIRVGQQANFTVDAYPGIVFPGVVSQIRKAPINVQNVVTYDVVIGVSNDDLKLFPGMTANVKIVTARAENALRLPVAALRFHPPTPIVPAGSAKTQSKARQQPAGGGTPNRVTVYVLDHGKLKAVRAQLGITDGNYTQVLSGLQEGEPVVTGTVSKTGSSTSPQGGPGGRRFGF